MKITDENGYLLPHFASDVKLYVKSGIRMFSLTRDLLNKILRRERKIQPQYMKEIQRIVKLSQDFKEVLMKSTL